MGHKSEPKPRAADPYAQQQAAIAAEQWAMAKPIYEEMAPEMRKPVEEQSYFKRMMGGIEKSYGDIGGQMRRTLGGRYQYGAGIEGESAKNLELSRARTKAGAWQAGEEARRSGLMGLASGGTSTAMQGFGAGSQSALSIMGMEQANRQAKMSGISSGVTSICCWNFLAAHGSVPEEVRWYRDEHYPKGCPVSKGYKWMSEFAVPLMEQYPKFAKFMDWVMARPMTKYAQWYYGKNCYGWIFKPIAIFWTGLWGEWGMKIPQAKKYYNEYAPSEKEVT